MKKVFTIIALFLLLPFVSFAQKNVNKGNQQWLQYYVQGKVNNRWTWVADATFRWKEFAVSTKYFVRTGMSYSLHKDIRVTAGALIGGLYNGSFSNNFVDGMEIRPYQELLLKQGYDRVALQHRFRVEERFTRTFSIDNRRFNFRLRYRFMLNIPIVSFPQKQASRGLFLNIGNEVFLNAGNSIVYNVFSENRILVSTALQWNKKLTFTLTYNHQYQGKNAPNDYRLNGVFWLGVKHKFSFN